MAPSVLQNRRLGWIVVAFLLALWFFTYAVRRCPPGSRYDPADVTFNDRADVRNGRGEGGRDQAGRTGQSSDSDKDTAAETDSTGTGDWERRADRGAGAGAGTEDDGGAGRGDDGAADEDETDATGDDAALDDITLGHTVGDDELLDAKNRERRNTVREMMQHAWKGYRTHAWGMDELRPSSNTGMDWLGLGASIVDALDTLWIMGMHDEFREARNWVQSSFKADKNADVSVFETMIRVVGGFCSAYDLSGDELFLRKARDVADRLLWAFNTSSGIPYATVNLATHHASSPGWTGGNSILAEVGTVQLELKHLAYHLNNRFYHDKAERIIDVLDQQRKATPGLYGLYVSPDSGALANDMTSFGALGDSFYEYLLKQWLFTGRSEPKYRRMYDEVVASVRQRLIKKSSPSGLTYIAEWNSGTTNDKMDHLACFVAGMFALGADGAASATEREAQLQLGREIGETCAQMYKRMPTGIGPEMVYFRPGQDFVAGVQYYILRPETVESLFVLWRTTHEQKWRDYGWDIVQALNTHCRTGSGFAGLRDVTRVPPPKDDQQQSFFLAETLKYLYLLFSEDDLIPLDEWVFNTEAHPLRMIG